MPVIKMPITFDWEVSQRSNASQNDHKSKGLDLTTTTSFRGAVEKTFYGQTDRKGGEGSPLPA